VTSTEKSFEPTIEVRRPPRRATTVLAVRGDLDGVHLAALGGLINDCIAEAASAVVVGRLELDFLGSPGWPC
jgi:hypothetical protein